LNADLAFWHKRYTQQVSWSLQTRHYLFDPIAIQKSARILEVGCGTGALTESLSSDGFINLIGLDIDFQTLEVQISLFPLIQGDAFLLPFSTGSLDLVICHFLLLWLANPVQALSEMKRTVSREGYIIALGEPDYGGRINHPEPLAELGKLQSGALKLQGADPFIGRKLRWLFNKSGLSDVHCGIIGAEWDQKNDNTEDNLEWEVLRRDLADTITDEEFERLRAVDRRARQDGSHVRYVPLFYACGKAAA